MVQAPQSMMAESVRELRTSLRVLLDETPCPIVVVTSPEAGDGKTFVTANLAAAWAMSGSKVVVVSGDFRRPRMEEIFGIELGQPGFADVIEANWKTPDEDVRPHPGQSSAGSSTRQGPAPVPSSPTRRGGTRGTRDLGLPAAHPDRDPRALPPAGGHLPRQPRRAVRQPGNAAGHRPAALAGGHRAHRHTTGPRGPDTAILGSMAHGAVVVASEGRTDKAMLGRTIHRLETTHCHVLGLGAQPLAPLTARLLPVVRLPALRHRRRAVRRRLPTTSKDSSIAFGAAALLDECLRGLEGSVPVLVVDNSSDPEVRAVAARHRARYVDPGRNLGFAAGVNLGLSQRSRPSADLLLLNPDASIGPSEIAQLRHCLHRREDLACVAPTQSDPSTAATRIGSPGRSPLRCGAWVEAFGLGRLSRRADFLIGSVLLLRARRGARRRPLRRAVLPLRRGDRLATARARDRGWGAALCPEVAASHVGAGTGGDESVRETHFHASTERYVRKHHGTAGWWVFRTGVMTGSLLRSVLLPAERAASAAFRLRLYRTGPCNAEEALL